MSRMKKYQDRKAALVAEMQAILELTEKEDRDPSEEENAEFAALEAGLKGVSVKLEREERLVEHERGLERMRDINEDTPEEAASRSGEKVTAFASLGEFAQAVANASRRGGSIDERLRISAATGMSEGIPSDGGFLVQTDLQANLLTRLWDTMKLWNLCSNVPISGTANGTKINAINETDRADGSRWGGIRAYWKAEAAAKEESAPKFRQIELNLKKLVGLCYATDELLEDAAALDAVLQTGFAEEFGFKLDDAVLNGTGAGQPQGILNALCTVSVAKETGQAATTLVAENVEKMYARMWPSSLNNAAWFVNQECWPQIFKFHHSVGTGGVPMFIPAGGLTDAPFGTLLGRPIIPCEQCQALGTKGDIYFADLSQYMTCTKGGVQAAQSIHLKFNYDETTFRWVYRADGQPIWNNVLTPYKGTSSTVSPFITLATR